MNWLAILVAAALSTPASAAILYRETVTTFGGTATIDNTIFGSAVTRDGYFWVGVTGGRLASLDYAVIGELTKLWWQDIGPDEFGQPIPDLTGNEYFLDYGCPVTRSAPSCASGPSFRAQLKNDTVRIGFTAPRSYNACLPFDGVFNSDCAELYEFGGARFSALLTGEGDITFTIYDTRLSGAVPEPATWALLIAGFGLSGTAVRRRRGVAT